MTEHNSGLRVHMMENVVVKRGNPPLVDCLSVECNGLLVNVGMDGLWVGSSAVGG